MVGVPHFVVGRSRAEQEALPVTMPLVGETQEHEQHAVQEHSAREEHTSAVSWRAASKEMKRNENEIKAYLVAPICGTLRTTEPMVADGSD